jgi:hypothetical protein
MQAGFSQTALGCWYSGQFRGQLPALRRGLIMKTVLAFVAALFLYVAGSQPADAQTRTVRHPATASPALTVDLPGGWTTSIDPDNNLIIVSPNTGAAFSLTLTQDEPGYTLDRFAREALGVAKAYDIVPGGPEWIPPFTGSLYYAKMKPDGSDPLNLRMIITKVDTDKVASATLITGPGTSAEEKAMGEMILKTVRVVR